MENIFSNKVVVGLLGLGVLFILGSIGSSTGVNEAAVLAGIGCFLGICSRVLQAEIHQIENRKISDEKGTNPGD
tara:strand:+ start:304 stop:525 length:222 start_codon:yes stop_codon:yes gene_type:complete